jgi:uncharacterized protein YggE
MENSQEKSRLFKVAFVFMVILVAFFAVKTLSELRNYTGSVAKEPSTITLSGHGEMKAVPDIANISFTISKDAKTVKEAQTTVAEIEKSVLGFLAKNNIAEKDIKTTDSSFYPKYEYKNSEVCTMYGCNNNSVIVGYTASETIQVKIRDVDNAGVIVTGLGALKISNLSGPNFAIDDEDTLKATARKEAIADAKAKAEILAKDLGVRLVRITNFSENGNYPMPMYARDAVMNQAEAASAPKLALPTGENTVSSDVTITYEIR